MLSLTMLPAADGDCFVLTYGDDGRCNNVVIDCGRSSTYERLRERLVAMRDAGERFELLVVTHVDDDHISGAVALAKDADLPLAPEEVWFNGRRKDPTVQELGFASAKAFAEEAARRGWLINHRFDGADVALVDGEPLPVKRLAGGLRLTLLSPDQAALARLRRNWSTWEAGRAEPDEKPDELVEGLQMLGRSKRSPPAAVDVRTLAEEAETLDNSAINGSSIAFLAEWNGHRILMAADANPYRLETSLKILAGRHGPLRIDLCKVPHHGSAKNMSRGLLEAIDCSHFAISADGAHDRPDPQAVARIVADGKGRRRTLLFNHRQPWTQIWDTDAVRKAWNVDCRFPAEPRGGIVWLP